jgi:hypothetical protein
MTFSDSQAMFNENAGNIYQALEFRRNYHAMNNGKAGVLRDNDFLCSISSTNIVVAYGSAYINDSLTLAISQYFARTVDDTASTTLAVTPNNTLLARNDLVTLRVLDTARGDASDNCAIVIETGVAVSSFARSLVLASFTVAAGANVATALIDTRRFAGTYQGVQRCTSTTRPTLPASVGDQIYETDRKLSYAWSGSAWVLTGEQPYGPRVAPVGNTITLSGIPAVGKTLRIRGYARSVRVIADTGLRFRCNGIAGANDYSWRSPAGMATDVYGYVGQIPAASAAQVWDWATYELFFPNYTLNNATANRQQAVTSSNCEQAANYIWAGTIARITGIAVPINTVTLIADTGDFLNASSFAQVYLGP